MPPLWEGATAPNLGNAWLVACVVRFQRFPMPPEAVFQSARAAKGRATGLTPHEARKVASDTAQTREARPRQVPCLGAVAPQPRMKIGVAMNTHPKVKSSLSTSFTATLVTLALVVAASAPKLFAQAPA